jgi:hypothetical protein
MLIDDPGLIELVNLAFDSICEQSGSKCSKRRSFSELHVQRYKEAVADAKLWTRLDQISGIGVPSGSLRVLVELQPVTIYNKLIVGGAGIGEAFQVARRIADAIEKSGLDKKLEKACPGTFAALNLLIQEDRESFNLRAALSRATHSEYTRIFLGAYRHGVGELFKSDLSGNLDLELMTYLWAFDQKKIYQTLCSLPKRIRNRTDLAKSIAIKITQSAVTHEFLSVFPKPHDKGLTILREVPRVSFVQWLAENHGRSIADAFIQLRKTENITEKEFERRRSRSRFIAQSIAAEKQISR